MNTQKLRDMNLHEVADELEQLRAFKEAAEMQEPVAVMYKTGGALTKAECIDVEIFDICCRVETPLYAKPLPADKPAVAVPDGWNIVTSENWNIPKVGQRVILFSNGVIQEESYTLDQADGEPGCGYYFWNRDDLDECPEVKAGDMWMLWPSSAAPSHSQQSVDLIDEFATQLAEKFPFGMSANDVFAEVKSFKLDRCPSHDSEQGGNDV